MLTYIIIGAIILLAVFLFATGYLKAPPDTAYIISGLGSKKRILIGKAGFRVPFFERVDKLSLGVMQVDVKTSEAVPTNEFINVSVDGVANIKISSDPQLLERASEALLGKNRQELVALVTQVLEGNMREIVGSVGLKEMVQDRQGVAKKITENVVPDMEKLGIEVVNFNIQNFKDGAGTIVNMGIDNVEQIRKNAQIAKANAQRDIAIATSKAQQEANAVKVESEKMIAEQNAELAVQQAEMKVRSDAKRAEADAAYSIQHEEQRKVIEIAKTNADIARREKEAELADKDIAIKERELDAQIKKQADALKYQSQQEAEAELIRDLNLLTLKPILFIANVGEDEVADAMSNPHVQKVQQYAAEEGAEVIAVSAKVESEIAELDDEDAKEFLAELGLAESGLDKLIKASFKLLGLITFLTAGEQETRAWTIRKGTKAPQAGGKIHSDIERGFIRAEIVSYDDLMAAGSQAAAREKGQVRLEGKEYVMQDGDVTYFRFNV